MHIAVTGSIATDHLMTYPGRFAASILDGRGGTLSVSFLVESLDIRRGGVAANICLGMARLGLAPLLVDAAGTDAQEYLADLAAEGIRVEHVLRSRSQLTARFTVTTDRGQSQIASFYPGASSEAREIDIAQVHAAEGLDLVHVGAGDPAAMLRHTARCRELGISFVADPAQQLASLDADDVRALIDGAAVLFTNEHEARLVAERTGWTSAELGDRVSTHVTTRGAAGIVVQRRGESEVKVEAVSARSVADPTGAGDAFRAGYHVGRARGLDEVDAARLGACVATHAVESLGAQDYVIDLGESARRLDDTYGREASERIVAALGGRR